MSSQAQGVLEGEISGPEGPAERREPEAQDPQLNGREGRFATQVRELDAFRAAATVGSEYDLPGTEPVRMDGTAHGTRADGTRAQPHPYRAQVNEHSVPQQQGVPHRQAQQPGGMMGQHDATVTLQQVTTRVVTTSPPEDLPAPPDQPHGAQAMWIARLGEFFQRRVTQAAAAVAPVLERSPRPNFRAIPPAPSSWGVSREAPLFTPEAEQVMQQWPQRAPLLHGKGAPGLPPPPLPVQQHRVILLLLRDPSHKNKSWRRYTSKCREQ